MRMRTLLVASAHKRRNAVVNPEPCVSTTFANSDVFVLMVSSLLRTAHASLKRDVKIVRFYLQKYVIFPIRRIFIIEICPGENKSYTTCAQCVVVQSVQIHTSREQLVHLVAWTAASAKRAMLLKKAIAFQ